MVGNRVPNTEKDRRSSSGRRAIGGRRKYDHQPRAAITRKGVAVIVAVINFIYLVVQAFGDQCVNWFR